MTDPTHTLQDGLWRNNPALVQLLGLCPLLAVSQQMVTALALGFVTLIVLTVSNLSISLFRRFLISDIRLPLQILVIATLVSAADLLLQAFFFELHQRIGLFVALIVTNCTILGRAELFARRNAIRASIADGFWMGLGFFWVITLLGGVREIIGRGTLFGGFELILGPSAQSWVIEFSSTPIIIAGMAPGAFLALGCIIAGKNWLDQRHESNKKNRISQQTAR